MTLRILQDPHDPEYAWRMHDFHLEFRWLGYPSRSRPGEYVSGPGNWCPYTGSEGALPPTPQREALWADLWVRPYEESPLP